jgi:hypothetical protein
MLKYELEPEPNHFCISRSRSLISMGQKNSGNQNDASYQQRPVHTGTGTVYLFDNSILNLS